MKLIIGIIIGVVATVIGSLIYWKIKKWIERHQRLEVKLSNAPRNLLDHVKPGVSVDKVKNILGVPHQNRNNQLAFKFKNVLIQVKLNEDSVTTITLLLNELSTNNNFKVSPLNKTLGKVYLNDVINRDSEIFRIHLLNMGKFPQNVISVIQDFIITILLAYLLALLVPLRENFLL